MKNRESKKSENIEVRISHEVKQALYTKAKHEGRTVSSVLRSLVDDYLITPLPSTVTPKQGNRAMLLKSLIQKPKTILATFLAFITMSSIILIPSAGAEEVHLDLSQEIAYFNTESQNSVSTRSYNHSLSLQAQESIDLKFPSEIKEDLYQDIILRLSTNGLSPSQHESPVGSKSKFDVQVQIIKVVEGKEQLLVNKSITATEGERANFLTGFENEAGVPAGIALTFTLSSEEPK